MLRKIIEEEASKFGKEKSVEDVDAEEVDADEYADTLEKDINYSKALKIEEAKLKRKVKRIQEERLKVRRRLIKKL